MLERQVHVGHERAALGKRLDDVVLEVRRVRVEESDPASGIEPAQFTQHFGQPVLPVKVDAVSGCVLGNDVELHRPVGQELLRVGDHALEGARDEPSADRGDGAVGAAVVAALAYPDVRDMGSGDAQAPPVLVLGKRDLPRAAGHGGLERADVVAGEYAGHEIHFPEFGGERLAVTLGEAAGDGHLEFGSFALQRGHFEDGLDGFGLGVLDEAAGVDEHPVGVGEVLDDHHARLGQLSERAFGVDEVLGAAERDDPESDGPAGRHAHLARLPVSFFISSHCSGVKRTSRACEPL